MAGSIRAEDSPPSPLPRVVSARKKNPGRESEHQAEDIPRLRDASFANLFRQDYVWQKCRHLYQMIDDRSALNNWWCVDQFGRLTDKNNCNVLKSGELEVSIGVFRVSSVQCPRDTDTREWSVLSLAVEVVQCRTPWERMPRCGKTIVRAQAVVKCSMSFPQHLTSADIDQLLRDCQTQ